MTLKLLKPWRIKKKIFFLNGLSKTFYNINIEWPILFVEVGPTHFASTLHQRWNKNHNSYVYNNKSSGNGKHILSYDRLKQEYVIFNNMSHGKSFSWGL